MVIKYKVKRNTGNVLTNNEICIMQILIVAATQMEIEPFTHQFPDVNVLITGVGIASTVFTLTQALHDHNYDLVIQAGICGAFNTQLHTVGKCVKIESDLFAEEGVFSSTHIETIFEMGLAQANDAPYKNGRITNQFANELLPQLEVAKAMTSNSIWAGMDMPALLQNKFKADVETMEGAAFEYVCAIKNIRRLQLRSISNLVGDRNKANWNIALAIKNLNGILAQAMQTF